MEWAMRGEGGHFCHGHGRGFLGSPPHWRKLLPATTYIINWILPKQRHLDFILRTLQPCLTEFCIYRPFFYHLCKHGYSNPYWPLSTMRTFFHCVFPTLGVWQNKILCLSQTKMRSRTNLLMETWVKFLRLLFWHTLDSSSIRFSETVCQPVAGGTAEGWDTRAWF